MIGKIKHISDFYSRKYEAGTFAEFYTWISYQRSFQFDIETNVCKWWNEFEIRTMQFGSCTSDRVQWLLQWSSLTDIQKRIVKGILEDQNKQKLIHKASFEYVVCRFHGIIIENVYDTLVAEKVLMGGLETEDYALADISWKYLRIMMDKTLQQSFGDNILSDDKILYAITDVAYLDVIKRIQLADGDSKDLLYVLGLEMDAVLAFSEITYHGMIMNKEKWRENEALARPIVKAALDKINSWLDKEPFHSYAVAKGYVSGKDRLYINSNAHGQKNELIKILFPEIAGAGKPIIKKYISDRGKFLTPGELEILDGLMNGRFTPFTDELVKNHRDYLVENEYLVPTGTVTINWNSWQQVLPLVQLVEPKLTGVGEDEINKAKHPMPKDFKDYKDKLQMIDKYGESFIIKHVGPDGRVRTNFNQVVSTGRVSSSNPNMQNIIVTEEVGTRYRNAFIYEKGWVFVDSDFTGQELVLIAHISQDPVWMKCIEMGQDIHSVVAEMMFGKRWTDATEPGCAYYQEAFYDGQGTWMSIEAMKQKYDQGWRPQPGEWTKHVSHQKCSCKKHKTIRYDCKSIDFGLAYGMSEFKLAGDLHITIPEAKRLIDLFFSTFPRIGRVLQYLGDFGVRYGYIQTLAPFFRKRWFPYWREYRPWIEAHIQKIKFVPPLGDIERASKNQPIQGSGADMMKVAMVLVRNYIRDHDLWDMVHMTAQVHDQLTTAVPEEFSFTWKPILDELMVDAGAVIIPSRILKADTQISPVWTK